MKTTITIEDIMEHESILRSDVSCDSEYNGEEIDWDSPPLGPKLGWVVQFLVQNPETLDQIWEFVKHKTHENYNPELV